MPNSEIDISDEDTAAKVMKVMDALDDVADVVNVHTNANIVE